MSLKGGYDGAPEHEALTAAPAPSLAGIEAELAAWRTVAEALLPLDPDARERVLRQVASYYFPGGAGGFGRGR